MNLGDFMERLIYDELLKWKTEEKTAAAKHDKFVEKQAAESKTTILVNTR